MRRELIEMTSQIPSDLPVWNISDQAPRQLLSNSVFQVTASRWGVILAGGDGTRLSEMTRFVSGDGRPKQFCSLFGDGTLVEQARQRTERSILPDHILFPVTAAHRAFFAREAGVRPSQRIVQPVNKGTAPPIVHSLLSIHRQDSEAIVAILPCDHHYSDERAFTATLDSAFDTAARHADSVVLLGSPARTAQTEYGWIELGDPVAGSEDSSFRVRGFCEKPAADLARDLFDRGALWNTFVMVGHVTAFLELVGAARTGLLKAFLPEHLWAGSEVQIPDWLYERIYALDFSRDVLSRQPGRLIARRMDNVEWNDLGHPERVIDVLQAAGLKPWWLREWRAAKRPPGMAMPHADAAVA
jgi:mannose-1-phosphate guanylyltransferase